MQGTGSSIVAWLRATASPFVRARLEMSLFLAVVLAFAACAGAATYLSEDFEAGFVDGAPPGWTKAFLTGAVDWQRNVGDSSLNDGAHGGLYNAMLFVEENGSHETYLITPAMNLAGVANATLEFWHKQAFWTPDQDTLAVYYRTSSGGTWTLLASYTNNVADWTRQTIVLPNLTATYSIGFLGNATYGRGVCIDDVVVSGTPATWTIPVVTTTSPGSIASASSVAGGNVTSDGGAAVTARGICWSTAPRPTIAASHTTEGGGAGSFTSSITGLSPGTKYYVRAYATNVMGTAYDEGPDVTFTTLWPGDINGDGYVNVGDLQMLVANWGRSVQQ